MDGPMGGMMTGMWLWTLVGLLVVVLLVIVIVKLLRRWVDERRHVHDDRAVGAPPAVQPAPAP